MAWTKKEDSVSISHKFRAIIDVTDLEEIKRMRKCIPYHIIGLLSEQAFRVQLGLPPIAYERKYVEMYAHKKDNRVKFFIPASNFTLEYELNPQL
ncbi:hypothetical protein DRO54_02025 [Candidatus Bathyarchaeota archaeon]|nr:MAG: hypothetical protein DRO54_02025 [Candidatus Bathyarchaeota archaeon]